MKTLLLALVALVAPAPHPASPPSTHPTSQPTSQPAAPRADERVVDDDAQHFHFAVPKLWKSVPQESASVYVFGLPAVGESRRYAPSLIVTARDIKGGTLKEEVDARREAILSRNAGAKFDEDAAGNAGGHESWTFAYLTTLNQTVTEKPSGKQHSEKIAIRIVDQVVVLDGRALEFVLTSDDKGVVIRRRQIERVLQTLAVDPK